MCKLLSKFSKTLDLELIPSAKLLVRGETTKIAEISEQYSISADTLRYYECVGLIPTVNRMGSGIRDYNETDLKRVEFIKCMRKAGPPIDVLIDYVALVQQGKKRTKLVEIFLKTNGNCFAQELKKCKKH